MESRPPTSIKVALASATTLGLIAAALFGWACIRWMGGANRGAPPRVGSLFVVVALGVFIARTLRRSCTVRVPAIAIALPLAVMFAVMTLLAAVAPGRADRWSTVMMLGSVTLLAALIAVPLLRESARTWLNH